MTREQSLIDWDMAEQQRQDNKVRTTEGSLNEWDQAGQRRQNKIPRKLVWNQLLP